MIKKSIKIASVPISNGHLVQIVEQSHRKQYFGYNNNTNEFIAKNGFKLVSAGYPMYHGDYRDEFIMRGDDSKEDNNIVFITNNVFLKFSAAVREYNKVFNGEEQIDTKTVLQLPVPTIIQ